MKAERKWVFLIHEVRSSRLSYAWMEGKICELKTMIWEWISGYQPLRCLGLFFVRYLLPSRNGGWRDLTGDVES